MKKLSFVLLLIISLNSFGQASKWFVSFSTAPVFGGPAASLKKQMRTQGYDDNAESTFVIFGSGTTRYPRGEALAVLARGGKRISENKSLYFVGGISGTANIEGFKAEGYSNGIFGLFAGTYGKHVSVKYTSYQLTAGYQYSFQNTRAKLGVGPTVYLLHYRTDYNFSEKGKSQLSVTPGVSFMARIPLGREKKLFGIDLLFEGNMAPPVKMKSNSAESFQPKNANMFSFSTGLAFSFRRK